MPWPSDYDWRIRFQRNIEAQPNGCWEWKGNLDRDGYGRYGKKRRAAHRLAYEAFVGPIPDGMEIDHLCRNRACVHPLHLEAVAHRENVLAGSGVCAIHARKTHCKRGHEFTVENTYVFRGWRICRTCRRARGAWAA